MLIASSRHSPADLEAWQVSERTAEIFAQSKRHRDKIRRSVDAIMSFTGGGRCYAGVSWGKDSVVLAHLIAAHHRATPLVWVRVEPDFNPDCLPVRDAFLRMFPGVFYDEIVVDRGAAAYRAHGTLERGMAEAAKRHGPRYLSGVRAEESGTRASRMRRWGESSPNTCAPIGWWSGWDVFGYLVTHRLPIHPAYACTFGGRIKPTDLRVSPLGGERGARPGDGFGRAEWERRYYGRELAALAASADDRS